MTLSEVFWVAFVSTISAMVLKLASLCYKSKCKTVKCCGLTIERDIIAEEKEEELRITRDYKSPES